jgi:hypothetical protein
LREKHLDLGEDKVISSVSPKTRLEKTWSLKVMCKKIKNQYDIKIPL